MTDTSAGPGAAIVPGWLADLRQRQALSAEWAEVIANFPRSLTLPDLIWPFAEGRYLTVDRRGHPREWARWTDADVPIVTQWDDGRHSGFDPGEMATSSASLPTLVAEMLADLDVHPGHRVLDVGTGTGWTTGLLARRAGPGRVVGVEVDAGVAEAATTRLHAADVQARIVTGDGAKGWPIGAPYDRVQATFAVRAVPPAWVEQTRAGGLIVVPWGTRWTNTAAVARLRVGDDTAMGWFTRPVEFMLDRAQRGTWPEHKEYLPGEDWPADKRESTTRLGRAELAAAEFFIGLRVPAAVHTSATDDDDTTVQFIYGLDDRSWAAVFFCDDGCEEFTVYQGGPRSLWSEVESVYWWWQDQGEPDVTRFGLTVTPSGQQVFLDTPDNVISR